MKKYIVALSAFVPAFAFLLLPFASHAQTVEDAVTSSTAAIVSAGSTVFGVFFGVLPTILLYVVPIAIVLWGIKWVISHFKGGRR
jgi:uncharacterized membrane protein